MWQLGLRRLYPTLGHLSTRTCQLGRNPCQGMKTQVHRQNVPRQNVPRDKTSQDKTSQDKTSQDKTSSDIMSQGQNVPRTKLPQGQNVTRTKCPKDKTSQGTKRPTLQIQSTKNRFCLPVLNNRPHMLGNGPHPSTQCMERVIPILGRLGKAIPLSWPYWIR